MKFMLSYGRTSGYMHVNLLMFLALIFLHVLLSIGQYASAFCLHMLFDWF